MSLRRSPSRSSRVQTATLLLLSARGRRNSYSALLLGPGMGQRAGELCEGEVGRRGSGRVIERKLIATVRRESAVMAAAVAAVPENSTVVPVGWRSMSVATD
jgi:hypothetical protein